MIILKYYICISTIYGMKTKQKIVVLALSIVLSLFIIIDPVQSNKPNPIIEISDLLMPLEIKRFMQDNPKYQYVGIEKCASACHNNAEMGFQYNITKNGPHSQAYKILASKKAIHYAKNAKIKVDPRESTLCLRCHVTGGGLDFSFFAVTYKQDDGVTCEACHKGPYITKSFLPTETDCLKCHNKSVHKISDFDFKSKSAKIAHPRPKTELKKI
jgi:ferredoxin